MIRTSEHDIAADFEHWPLILKMLQCVIGPTIHRTNAVLNMEERGLGIILSQDGEEGAAFKELKFDKFENWKPEFDTQVLHVEPRHFMGTDGMYRVMTEASRIEEDCVWVDVDYVQDALLKLGTHLNVDLNHIKEIFPDRMNHAIYNGESSANYLRCWLRYPVETTVGDPTLVYVCHRVMRTKRSREWHAEVIGVPLKYVKIPSDDDHIIDFLTPMNPRPREGPRQSGRGRPPARPAARIGSQHSIQ